VERLGHLEVNQATIEVRLHERDVARQWIAEAAAARRGKMEAVACRERDFFSFATHRRYPACPIGDQPHAVRCGGAAALHPEWRVIDAITQDGHDRIG